MYISHDSIIFVLFQMFSDANAINVNENEPIFTCKLVPYRSAIAPLDSLLWKSSDVGGGSTFGACIACLGGRHPCSFLNNLCNCLSSVPAAPGFVLICCLFYCDTKGERWLRAQL